MDAQAMVQLQRAQAAPERGGTQTPRDVAGPGSGGPPGFARGAGEFADLWQTALEDGGAIALVLDREGRCHYCNRVFASSLGKSVGEIVGKRLHDLFSEEYASERLRIIERALGTGRGQQFMCSFAEMRIEACYRPIMPADGSPPRFVFVIGRLASSIVVGFEDADEYALEGGGRGVIEGLTARELDVLRMIGEGMSTAEIAAKLFRTPKTIEAHRAALGRKLGVSNRVQLARIAMRANLVSSEEPGAGRPRVRTRREPAGG